MFDIGIGEVSIIAVLALLVFGPERLPRAAADAARLVRQFRTNIREAGRTLEDASGISAHQVATQLERARSLSLPAALDTLLEEPTPAARAADALDTDQPRNGDPDSSASGT